MALCHLLYKEIALFRHIVLDSEKDLRNIFNGLLFVLCHNL